MTTANNTAATSIPAPPRGSASNGGSCASAGGVRFTLRKRSARSDDERPALSSYNSDFLSGLFADVAKANVLSEFNIPQNVTGEADTTALSTTPAVRPASHIIEESRPFKKSRLSLSTYRSRASCMNLATMELDGAMSPKGISEISSVQKTVVSPHPTKETSASSGISSFTTSTSALPKQDSLSFQLSLLEGDAAAASRPETTSTKTSTFKDVAMLAFPNLPATISDSSYSTDLTRENLARHVPSSETDATTSSGNKESSFGWFVDLDDGDHRDMATPSSCQAALAHAVSTDNLAFHAPTAPKRTSDDSEKVEWAQAADTVDSVLGDLF